MITALTSRAVRLVPVQVGELAVPLSVAEDDPADDEQQGPSEDEEVRGDVHHIARPGHVADREEKPRHDGGADHHRAEDHVVSFGSLALHLPPPFVPRPSVPRRREPTPVPNGRAVR